MPPRARQKTKTTPQTSPKREPQDQSTTHASEAGLLDPTPTQKTSLEPSQLFPSQTSLQFPESSIPSTQTNSDATPLLTSPNPPLNASQNTLMKAPSNPSMNASQNILMNASQNTLMNASQNILMNASQNTLVNASQNILMNASQNTLVNASQNTLMNTSPYPLLNTNNQQSQQLDVTDTGKGTKFSKKWTTPGSECFKPFLKASNKGDFWFYCGACKTDYRTSYLYGTNSHFETKIHLDSERQWYIDHPEAMEEQANEASQKSMIFYFKLLEFIAKKNISLNLADDIIAFLKENPQGVAGLKNTKVSRKKSSLILNKAVRPLILDGIDEILSQKYWSLLIDECTDKSKKKYLAIFVQFWVKGTGIKCLLYRLINCSEALNSEEIYKLIDSAILSKPFAQNLIGFASDGAAVMRGSKNSVLQKMKMTHPKIFDVHCISHCFNLLGNYATEVLPEAIEFLVKQIFNHFAHSAFRVSRWLTLQEHMNLKPYKMLTYGQTRWCSLEAAISRILERWSALIEYFQIVKGEDAQVIVPLMEKEETKIYFEFLKLYLHKINELCLKFQKNVSEVCSIDTSITNFYSSCMNVLLKDEYRKIPFDQKLKLVAKVENSKTMTIEEKYMKTAQELDTHIKLIYGNVISLASVSQEDKRLDIVSHIQQFIMRLLYKAKKILPFDNKLLKQLPSIFPPTFNFDEAFSLVQNYDNIIPSEQSHLVWEDLQNFSDNISTLQKLFEKEKLDITSFYNHKIVRDNFQYFAEFATALLSLPLSTAEVERSFSQLKMVKTDRRNQLKDSTLEALMLNKYYQINFDDQIMRKKAAMRYHQISYDLKDSENDKKRARISEDQPETLSELEKERLKRKKKECLGSLMLAEFEDELIDIKFKKPGSITFKF